MSAVEPAPYEALDKAAHAVGRAVWRHAKQTPNHRCRLACLNGALSGAQREVLGRDEVGARAIALGLIHYEPDAEGDGGTFAPGPNRPDAALSAVSHQRFLSAQRKR